MKTANVYEIERALQQPITPQQRQTAAANNPVAALLAQRLDGVEGSLRTKMQTPPPPQGTVMNQYYQWPQQQPEMGLAQPGLEQMAQQYASGGLVAFAEGGHTGYGDEDNMLFDTDGSNGYAGYADGGLATMLPMGYADEDDMPIFNGYADGGPTLRSIFPATFDEDEYDAGEGDFGDVGSGAYGLTERDIARDVRAKDIVQEREDAKHRMAEREAMQRYSAGPGDIVGKGVAGLKSLGSGLVDTAFIKDPNWEARKDPTERAKQEYEAVHGPVGEQKSSFSDRAGNVLEALGSLLGRNTESGEDRKRQQQQEENTAKQQERVDALEASNKQKKATPVSSTNPVRSEGPGTSMLSPAAWSAERGAGLTPSSAEYSVGAPTVVTDGQIDEVNLDPNRNAGAAAIVNSGLSTDQQIAALAKYFQTDTSEAMRIKGEMEKENAHAGNVGIMAALANALGLGLGTYGTGAARWGAGLAGMAQGLMSEEDRAAKRQASINELGLKIKEMEGSGTRKAAETVLSQRAKAAAEADEERKALRLEAIKGGYREKVANIGASASMRNKDVDVANRGAGGNERLQVQKDQVAAGLIAKAQEKVMLPPNSPGYMTALRSALSNALALAPPSIQQMFPNIDSVMSAGGGGAGAAPTGRSIGRIQGDQLIS